MIIGEYVEFLPLAHNSPLPSSERATLYVELTPFLSRNNRPSSIAERIPCISILNRLKRNGTPIPRGHDLRKCEGINDVSASIAARILHELKVGGEVAVQAAATNGMVMSAVTKAVKDGHNVMITYTDAINYTGVPREAAPSFIRTLASIQVRVAKLMVEAAACRLYLSREVKYSRLRFHGDTALHMAYGARVGSVRAQKPYVRDWVEIFDQAVHGLLDVNATGLTPRQVEALRPSVHLAEDNSEHDDCIDDDPEDHFDDASHERGASPAT